MTKKRSCHPPDRRIRRVPIGIDRVLYRAATDRTFYNVLLCDRRRTLAEWGLQLTQAEAAVLDRIDDEALRTMIDAVRPEKHGRRRFMAAVAGASAASVGVVHLAACDILGGPTGSRPDPPPDGGNEVTFEKPLTEPIEDTAESGDATPTPRHTD